MSYNDDPSAFLAVKASIVTVAHRYENLSEEASRVDMKMAYGAEYGPAFAKMGISPYFHGYVRSGCMAWQEAPRVRCTCKAEVSSVRTATRSHLLSLVIIIGVIYRSSGANAATTVGSAGSRSLPFTSLTSPNYVNRSGPTFSSSTCFPNGIITPRRPATCSSRVLSSITSNLSARNGAPLA